MYFFCTSVAILLLHCNESLFAMRADSEWECKKRWDKKSDRNSSLVAMPWTRWGRAGRDDTSQRINGLRGSQGKPAVPAWHLCTCKSTEMNQSVQREMDRLLPSVPFNNACKANRRKCEGVGVGSTLSWAHKCRVPCNGLLLKDYSVN